MSDKITDRELAEALKQYGQHVQLPIDRKKRPILVKKLNHYKAREKSPLQPKKSAPYRRTKRPEPQAEEFSSEDSATEDDISSKSTAKLFNRKSQNKSLTSFYSNTDTLELSPTYTRPKLRNRAKNDGPSNSSISSNSKLQNKTSLYPDIGTLITNKFNRKESQGINQSNSNLDYSPEEFTDSDPDESMYEVVNKSINTTFTIENNHENPSDSLNLGRYGGNLRSRAGKSSQKPSSGTQHTNPKYIMPNNSYTEDEIKEQGFRTSEQTRRFSIPRETSISTCIVALVIAFFLAIAVTYIFMRRSEISDFIYSYGSLSESDNLLICKGGVKEGCYPQTEVNKALEYIGYLEKHLSEVAGNARADNSLDSKVSIANLKLKQLDKDQILNWTKDQGDGNEGTVPKVVLDLIVNNPHWGLKAYDKEKTPAEKAIDVKFLEGYPVLSLLERIITSIYRIFWGIMLLLLCIVFAVGFIFLLRYHLKLAEEEQVKVYELVESIIFTIKNQYDLSEMNEEEGTSYTPYIAVQHVRDRLLAPLHRKKLMPIWNKAVKFIRENESRVRFEIQTIQGEDFEVFKWIQSAPTGSKVWQGQAFGENNSSAMTLTYGPTPCLKIRNMFSPEDENEEDWELTVQDALLEKCKGNNGILHIYVEKSSKEGCVYMKCNSCESAYKAYRSLHGWWFDGRLVTVKYLRLEHYHDRFPDARRATKPLKPSNNKMSSLSQPFHRSTLEMT